jgi:hypothetical protein
MHLFHHGHGNHGGGEPGSSDLHRHQDVQEER